MENIEEKKFKIRTNKNKEMELFLRNYNNEELSIKIYDKNESIIKKYELRYNLEKFQNNRFFKIFYNVEEIMKELENKISNSIFIEEINYIIIQINIGLTIIDEIALAIEEKEKDKDEIIEEFNLKIKNLENELNEKDNIIKKNEEKDNEIIEKLKSKINILENKLNEKDDEIKLNEKNNYEIKGELNSKIKTLENKLNEVIKPFDSKNENDPKELTVNLKENI